MREERRGERERKGETGIAGSGEKVGARRRQA
jgi:hypothetical protein